MLIRFTELVKSIEHMVHITEPLLFRLALFLWACVEMARFIWTVALGHGA